MQDSGIVLGSASLEKSMNYCMDGKGELPSHTKIKKSSPQRVESRPCAFWISGGMDTSSSCTSQCTKSLLYPKQSYKLLLPGFDRLIGRSGIMHLIKGACISSQNASIYSPMLTLPRYTDCFNGARYHCSPCTLSLCWASGDETTQ